MSLFDRGYMRPSRPESPGNGMQTLWALIAINAVMFLLVAPPGSRLYGELCLTIGGIREFRLYQLVTAGFLHAGFGHIFFNMWGLYIFGTLVVPHIGGRRFFWLYLIGAVSGNLLFLLFSLPGHVAGLVGASGAVCAVMMAAAMLEPDRRFIVFLFPVPLKTSTLVIGYTILEIVLELSGAQAGIAHLAHLGGFLGGYLFLKALYGPRLPWDPLRHKLRPGEWMQPPREETRKPGRFDTRSTAKSGPVTSRELDALLDKISRHGINSLSEEELARLRQAREQMRGR